MIDYDSFLHCHLKDIFFAIHAGAKELSVFLRALFSLKASKKLRFVILLKNIFMLHGTTSVEKRDLASKNLKFLSLVNVKPQSQSCNKDLVNKFG